jgi:predicted Zn-dependent protease
MKRVDITVFGARPGAGHVTSTTAHEVGHALGAGHANGTNDLYLMEPTLNSVVAPSTRR